MSEKCFLYDAPMGSRPAAKKLQPAAHNFIITNS